MINKKWIAIASLFFSVAVIIGAFAAHGLKKIASLEIISSIQTGVTYQYYHSFALLFLGLLYEKINTKNITRVASLFILGIFFFSFSIYFLNGVKIFSSINNPMIYVIAIITPIGGLLFILGWLILFWEMVKNTYSKV